MERPPSSPNPENPSHHEQQDSLAERLHLKEQWTKQVKVLQETGFLSIIPETHDFGYKDKGGNIYPVPTHIEIAKWLKHEEQAEFLEKKREQGFTRLLLVPSKLPLSSFIKNYQDTIASHRKEGTLLLSDGTKVTGPPYEGEEVRVWEEYENADSNGKLIYTPKEFSRNHGGIVKGDIPEGWTVILTEDLLNLPQEGKGETKGGRHQLETNKTPIEYLKLLQTTPPYKGEVGYTPETYIIDAITRLEECNQTTDDLTYSYLTGAYFFSAGRVPWSYFYRGARRAHLGGGVPGVRRGDGGVRVSVGVRKS